jgi:acyl-CoA synthetase (AMP-forming)/AMP-acid ligase II
MMPSAHRKVIVADSPLTVPEILRQQSHSRGDHPLLVCDSERLSYADADHRSAHLARGLVALGAGKGTHIGVLYPNGAQWVVAMLAAARIGAIVIPFSTFSTAPEMREQIVDSDAEILLTTASYRSHDYVQRLAEALEDNYFRDRGLQYNTVVPQLRHVLIDTEPAATVDKSLVEAMERDVDAADPLAIVYTSGSTTAPKGVVHTHASLLAHQNVLNEIRGLTAQDKLFCNSPFFWIGGIAFAVLATPACRLDVGVFQRHRPRRDAIPARGRKAHHDQRFRRRHRPHCRSPQPRPARSVLHASRKPVPDHGARRAARRPRVAAHHARHDRSGQRHHDQ